MDDELGEKIVIQGRDPEDEEWTAEYTANKYKNDEQVDFFLWDGYMYCKKTLDLPDYKQDIEKIEAIILEDENEKEICSISDEEEIKYLAEEFVNSAKEELWTEAQYADVGFSDVKKVYYINIKYKDIKPKFILGSFGCDSKGLCALENYEAVWAIGLWKLGNQSEEIIKRYLQ